MNEEDRRLAEECARLEKELTTASGWLVRNKELVGQELKSHEKTLRKAGRLMRSCEAAARRKMCAGVFGPSQAGKSYLISTLAGNAERKLWTQIGDSTYDFLSEINPPGGKESTGLVTRFTLTRPAEPPAGFPVHVRLLSLIDVVKILTNTYFSDAEHMDAPDRESMQKKLLELEKRKTSTHTGGLTEDDVEDLQEYIHKYFRSKARVQQLLDRHFWDRVIPLAPCLEDEDRAELFGLIWDGIPAFNALLLRLSNALRALAFAPEAFCSANALIPRDNSIIDVATLGDLSHAEGDMLDVTPKGGARTSLPRTYVAALTAELVITMRDKPADFFDHTDLLDFPGYRSRKMFVDLPKETEEPAKLKECFLRGKVAYLFERYCAERELTSLLLCIGSGVQEVQGLGGAVSDWIAGTHGGTPERRADKDNALFFILTKSDLEFEDKAGAKDVSERWDTRMYTSMELFTSHDWLKKWTPDKPFRNFFLMRNPTVKLHLFDHDEQGNETGFKQETLPYVQQFEKAFMHSPLINERFTYKEETWKAFLTPNDGGLSLIRERLAPICTPELKRKQIRTTVEEHLMPVRNRLHSYWKSDDKEETRKQQALLGQNLARVFLAMAKAGQFGIFTRLLTVRDQELYDLYFQAQYQMQEELAKLPAGAAGVSANGEAGDIDDMLADLLGEDALIPSGPKKNDVEDDGFASSDNLAGDESRTFGDHIMNFWIDRLRGLADDVVLQDYFAFPNDLFTQFVHELKLGFMRLGSKDTMENALKMASRYANIEKERLVWKQAALAAGVVNAFLNWFGFDPASKNEAQRTVSFGSKTRVLFTPLPEIDGLPPLKEEPTDYASDQAKDWVAALIHLVNENVNFDEDERFDPEQNRQLYAILEGLKIR